MVSKNNGEELSFFAKKVGSNYFLSGRRLEFSPLRGFNALAAPAPAASLTGESLRMCTVYSKIRTYFQNNS